MENNRFDDELASYVSFSLRMKPEVTFNGYYDDQGGFIYSREDVVLDDLDILSEKELATVEQLMDKYKKLKKFLPPNSTLENLQITSDKKLLPDENQNQGKGFRTIRINARQLKIAKEVSVKIEEIYNFYKQEEFNLAKKSYNSLHKFLSAEREDFIGDFKSSRELEDALGMYAVGANSDSMNHPTVGAGCFVLIEIILM